MLYRLHCKLCFVECEHNPANFSLVKPENIVADYKPSFISFTQLFRFLFCRSSSFTSVFTVVMRLVFFTIVTHRNLCLLCSQSISCTTHAHVARHFFLLSNDTCAYAQRTFAQRDAVCCLSWENCSQKI